MIRYLLVILLILCLAGCTIEKSPARISLEGYLKNMKNIFFKMNVVVKTVQNNS